jgi:ribose 5-phosphate isomerase B
MKIYLGSDHGGFELKERIKKWLVEWGYQVVDKGAFELDNKDDYPDFILPVAEEVARDSQFRGIILGRSGNGEAMLANKVKGIRAALCLTPEMAEKAREHNDANILSIGEDYIEPRLVRRMVKMFLETEFSQEGRHIRRLSKFPDAMENNNKINY